MFQPKLHNLLFFKCITSISKRDCGSILPRRSYIPSTGLLNAAPLQTADGPERVRRVLAPRRGEARRRAADERRHGSAAADLAEGAMGEAWLV